MSLYHCEFFIVINKNEAINYNVNFIAKNFFFFFTDFIKILNIDFPLEILCFCFIIWR